MTQKPVAIDLFAGIGGVKLGLEKAGFKVIFSNDIDLYCKQTFDHNFRDKLVLGDIRNIQSSQFPTDYELLAAGFPCQPFSMAGHKLGFNDPRGSLFFEVVRIIKDTKPKAILLENVQHLRHHNGGDTLKQMIKILEKDLGYKTFVDVLNSRDFGLPQNRSRIYIVGFKNETDFEFPKPIKKDGLKIKDILEKRRVEDSYFLSQKYYEGLVRHKQRHQKMGHGFGFNILKPDGVSFALVVGNMGRERNLIQDKPRKGFHKSGMDKLGSKNNAGIRKLTIRECARLQGFPDNFDFPVTKTQAYKQLGNTVSVPVIKAIAKRIYRSLTLKNLPLPSQKYKQPTSLRSGF